MKLYGSYTSPFVRHCRVALLQSGVDFEFVEADYVVSRNKSPTSKVPFLEDGDLTLTDSSSIVKYVRERSGRTFLADINDYELFAMTNTILDSAINLFLLENDGFGPDKINYLERQQNRVKVGLIALNDRVDKTCAINLDSQLRCACFIDWGLFRNRISIDSLANLQGLLDAANGVDEFIATAPPR